MNLKISVASFLIASSLLSAEEENKKQPESINMPLVAPKRAPRKSQQKIVYPEKKESQSKVLEEKKIAQNNEENKSTLQEKGVTRRSETDQAQTVGRKTPFIIKNSPDQKISHNEHYEASMFAQAEQILRDNEENEEMETDLIKPPVDREPCHFSAFYVSAQLLYWKANIPGMDYCLTRDFPTGNGTPIGAYGLAGNLHRAQWGYEAGGRYMAGYRFDRDFWELTGAYTHFLTRAHNHADLPSGPFGILVGTMQEFTTGSYLIKATSKSRLDYDIADLVLARCWDLSKYVNLRFKAGARGAWISNKWTVIYTANNLNTSFHQKNWVYQGFGIVSGLDMKWKLKAGFGLFMEGLASGVYGFMHNKTFSNNPALQPDGQGRGIIDDMKPHDHRNQFSMEFIGGICWDWNWGKYAIHADAGYDIVTWFGINQDYRTNATSFGSARTRVLDQTNLNLQGLTAGIGAQF